jgi:hypothetical protein
MLTCNVLANILPFNGLTTAAVSDSFDVFFVPAGYVFSIWGVIYLLLISFTIYAFLNRSDDNGQISRIAPWYLLSSVANSAWLLSWHYQQFGLSVVLMVVLLLSLIRIYMLSRPALDKREYWMSSLPFSVYLGWISVATIANIAAYLDYVSWNGFGIIESAWASIMITIAGLLGIIFALRLRDAAYTLVILWAITGIWVNFPLQKSIVTTVQAVGILLVVAVIFAVTRQKPTNAATN